MGGCRRCSLGIVATKSDGLATKSGTRFALGPVAFRSAGGCWTWEPSVWPWISCRSCRGQDAVLIRGHSASANRRIGSVKSWLPMLVSRL